MEYRYLPHGNEKISVIGLGTSSIGELEEKEFMETIQYAIDHGINYFDLASGHANTFELFGKAIKNHRKDIYLQIHFGANYVSGEYGWTMDIEDIKKSISWQLEQLQTDYIDFGFIHCLDENADKDSFINNGVLDYIMELKEKGMIKHIGLSTHTPSIAHSFLDMGILDVVMFSINPAYDHQQGEYAFGETSERMQLYRRCEKEGVALSVMKTYCAGQLLDKDKSPFHYALTESQCIQYALDKPAVMTVLPGVKSLDELKRSLHYLDATDKEKDYSILSKLTHNNHQGKCVYCRHCHPCPVKLDISLINKYYDLALLGDELAKDHYQHLEKKASDCIRCGHCNHRCPFHVHQLERMQKIQEYFGE